MKKFLLKMLEIYHGIPFKLQRWMTNDEARVTQIQSSRHDLKLFYLMSAPVGTGADKSPHF